MREREKIRKTYSKPKTDIHTGDPRQSSAAVSDIDWVLELRYNVVFVKIWKNKIYYIRTDIES